MQPNIQTRPVYGARRNATALSAALAVCLALAFPMSGYAASDAQPTAVAKKAGDKMAAKKYKVIFHVSDDDQKLWNQSLNNMAQLQKVLGKDNVEVELAVNGYGIGMLKLDSVVGNRVNDAVANGIKVVACEATMHGFKLTKDAMLASIGYVPGGAIEVVQKQTAGWAYLKP